MLDEFQKLGLAGWEVVRRRGDQGTGAGLGGVPGQPDGFDEGCVGDSHQHGKASGDLPAGACDEFSAQAMTQAGSLAAGPENKEAVDSSCHQVLNQPLQSLFIQLVSIDKRGDHGWNDSMQGAGNGRTFRTFQITESILLPDCNIREAAAIIAGVDRGRCRNLSVAISWLAFEYLRDICQRISKHPQSSIDDLLPDKWKAARVVTIA